MSDTKFFRKVISHRTAARELIKIAEELLPHGRCSLGGDHRTYDGYDQSIRSMIREIKRLKSEVKEYNDLKKALRITLTTPFNNI